MGEYVKSAETKAKLLEAARQLYWKNGFKKARNKDIAAQAGMPESLITYHFGSKDRLAAEVYVRIIDEIAQKSTAALGKAGIDDAALQYMTGMRVTWALMFSCPEYRRFYSDIARARILVEAWKNSRDDWLRLVCEQLGLNVAHNERELITLSYQSSITEIIISIEENYLEMSQEQIADWGTRIILRLIGLEHDRTEAMVEQSREALGLLDIGMRRYFSPIIKPKEA